MFSVTIHSWATLYHSNLSDAAVAPPPAVAAGVRVGVGDWSIHQYVDTINMIPSHHKSDTDEYQCMRMTD